MKTKNVLDHVRHDPALCLAPGLFRCLKKGQRKTEKLDIQYNYGQEKLEFSAAEPLGINDLRVLQAIVALAGPEGQTLDLDNPQTEEGKHLAKSLIADDDDTHESTLALCDSLSRIARDAGYTQPNSGSAMRQVRKSIERLWKVSVIVEKDKVRHGFRLLSKYASDETTGFLSIAVHPRIAEAVLGKRRYARISLLEARQLHTDAARLLHQRLCAMVDLGSTRSIGINKLVGYVWPTEPSNPTLNRKHVWVVRKALEEIDSLDRWFVSECNGVFKICRKQLRVIDGNSIRVKGQKKLPVQELEAVAA